MSPSYEPIRDSYRTVPELVYSRLREDILAGALPPGEWIRQDVVAREMQISKIPVREALRRLEADGFVHFEPNRGARVSDLSIAELQELYVVRAALEPFAARLAAPMLLPEDLVALETNLRSQDVVRLEGNARALSAVTREFHFIIYRRTGRARLCAKIEALWDGCRRYQRAFLELPGGTDWTVEGHHGMLAACRAGDAAALESAVREHIVAIAAGAEAAVVGAPRSA